MIPFNNAYDEPYSEIDGYKLNQSGPKAFHTLRKVVASEHAICNYLARKYYDLELEFKLISEIGPHERAIIDVIERRWQTNPISKSVIESFDEIFGDRDLELDNDEEPHTGYLGEKIDSAMRHFNTVAALVLVADDFTYLGHIYVYPGERIGEMSAWGIRTSMLNLSIRSCRQVTEKLMSGVMRWGKSRGYSFLRVIHPFPTMHAILIRFGFVFDSDNEPTLNYREEGLLPIEVIEYGAYYQEALIPIIQTKEFKMLANVKLDRRFLSPQSNFSQLSFRLLYKPREVAMMTLDKDEDFKAIDFFNELDKNITKLLHLTQGTGNGVDDDNGERVNCWQYTEIIEGLLEADPEQSNHIVTDDVAEFGQLFEKQFSHDNQLMLLNYSEPDEHWLIVVKIKGMDRVALFEVADDLKRQVKLDEPVQLRNFFIEMLIGITKDRFYGKLVKNRPFMAIFKSYSKPMSRKTVLEAYVAE